MWLLWSLFGSLSMTVLLGVLRGAGREGAVAGYGLANDQGVHVVRALVGVDALYICHVLHHAVVEEDAVAPEDVAGEGCYLAGLDRKSTRLNSSHATISYAVF